MKLLFISVECWTWHSTRKHQHDTNEIVCVCAKVSEGEEFIITNILLIPWACYMMQVSSFSPPIFLSHFAPICLLSLSSLLTSRCSPFLALCLLSLCVFRKPCLFPYSTSSSNSNLSVSQPRRVFQLQTSLNLFHSFSLSGFLPYIQSSFPPPHPSFSLPSLLCDK